jgi:hypothetical protein
MPNVTFLGRILGTYSYTGGKYGLMYGFEFTELGRKVVGEEAARRWDELKPGLDISFCFSDPQSVSMGDLVNSYDVETFLLDMTMLLSLPREIGTGP